MTLARQPNVALTVNAVRSTTWPFALVILDSVEAHHSADPSVSPVQSARPVRLALSKSVVTHVKLPLAEETPFAGRSIEPRFAAARQDSLETLSPFVSPILVSFDHQEKLQKLQNHNKKNYSSTNSCRSCTTRPLPDKSMRFESRV